MEFTQLLQDVDVFNNQHSSFLNENDQDIIQPIEEVDYFQNGKDAIVDAYKNYQQASSYYSEAYGKLTVSALSFPFSVELWMTTAKYENGDLVQQIIAKEVGDFFGGKIGAMIAFYKISDDLIYKNFTWSVSKAQNKWVANFGSNWQTQTPDDYVREFGATIGTSIYKVDYTTTVKELYFEKIKDSQNNLREYHIQYNLNPTLSTKLYKGFISYVLSIVEPDFVKSLNFKESIVSAIVDSAGNLKTARYKDTYDFTAYLRKFGIYVTASCNSEMSYMYTAFNEPINYERPNV